MGLFDFVKEIGQKLFNRDEEAAEKFTISADNLFSANSNEIFVLVLFSKNKFKTETPCKEGTFFIGLFITSLKLTAVLKINSISSLFIYLIPSKSLVDNLDIILIFYDFNFRIFKLPI